MQSRGYHIYAPFDQTMRVRFGENEPGIGPTTCTTFRAVLRSLEFRLWLWGWIETD